MLIDQFWGMGCKWNRGCDKDLWFWARKITKKSTSVTLCQLSWIMKIKASCRIQKNLWASCKSPNLPHTLKVNWVVLCMMASNFSFQPTLIPPPLSSQCNALFVLFIAVSVPLLTSLIYQLKALQYLYSCSYFKMRFCLFVCSCLRIITFLKDQNWSTGQRRHLRHLISTESWLWTQW